MMTVLLKISKSSWNRAQIEREVSTSVRFWSAFNYFEIYLAETFYAQIHMNYGINYVCKWFFILQTVKVNLLKRTHRLVLYETQLQ